MLIVKVGMPIVRSASEEECRSLDKDNHGSKHEWGANTLE